jgi:spoIIIJ-associated protein
MRKEFEGRTIEEAIQKAVFFMNEIKEELKIEVLNEGNHGLFGMNGKKPAKVRVSAKNSQEQSTPRNLPTR